MPKGVYRHQHRGHTASPPAAKLEDPELHQVARWLGEFQPPMAIPTLIRDTFGKRVVKSYGHAFLKRKRWAFVIDRYRQEYLTKIAEVPLFHKKYRLERLQRLLATLDHQVEAQSLSSQKYEERLIKVLREARYETEEKKEEHSWYFTNVQLTNASDEELVQRRADLLKRIQQFRLPLRKVTHAVGNGCEVLETTSREGAENDGGGDPLRDGVLDVSPGRSLGGPDGGPAAPGA